MRIKILVVISTFDCLFCDTPAAPEYEVYISQLIISYQERYMVAVSKEAAESSRFTIDIMIWLTVRNICVTDDNMYVPFVIVTVLSLTCHRIRKLTESRPSDHMIADLAPVLCIMTQVAPL